jgi:hypothetical protein
VRAKGKGRHGFVFLRVHGGGIGGPEAQCGQLYPVCARARIRGCVACASPTIACAVQEAVTASAGTLVVGSVVYHPKRGKGTVVAIDRDDMRDKPLRILYEDDPERHHCNR